jgi:hypothetical protein
MSNSSYDFLFACLCLASGEPGELIRELLCLMSNVFTRCLVVSDRLAGAECGRPSYSRDEESVLWTLLLNSDRTMYDQH